MKTLPVVFNKSGQQIIGILNLPDSQNKAPLVILCHGWSGNRLGTWNAFFVKAAKEFTKKGFAVLRFDFRGSGDSDGEFEDQTITSMLSDLSAIIKQLKQFKSVDSNRIVLIGHSQGGYISLLKTPEEKSIKCLILWNGRSSDLKDFWSKTWFEELKRKGFIIDLDYKVTKNYVEDANKYESYKAIKKLTVPVGLIYGDADTVVPPSEGLRILKNLKGKKGIKIIPHLDHDFSGEENKKQVILTTLDWLQKWLK